MRSIREQIEDLKSLMQDISDEIECITNSYYYDGNEAMRTSLLTDRWESYHRLAKKVTELEKELGE